MEYKDIAVPSVSIVFAAGISFASLESVAQDTETLDKRVSHLESKEGHQKVVDLKIEGIEERLDKMEEMMNKMVEIQQKQAINQAKICAATNAGCD